MFWHRVVAVLRRRQPSPEIGTITTYPPSVVSARFGGASGITTSGPCLAPLPAGFHPADAERPPADHSSSPDCAEHTSECRTTSHISDPTLPGADEFGWRTV